MTTSTRPPDSSKLAGRPAFVVLTVILIADFMELLDATIAADTARVGQTHA